MVRMDQNHLERLHRPCDAMVLRGCIRGGGDLEIDQKGFLMENDPMQAQREYQHQQSQ